MKGIIRLTGNEVLVKRVERPKTTKSGLVLASSAYTPEYYAEVIMVALGDKDNPVTAKVGDKVMTFTSGTEVTVNEERFYMLRETDIKAFMDIETVEAGKNISEGINMNEALPKK